MMKKLISRLNKIVILLAMMFVATACNTEDDIDAIFRERTWYLTYIKAGNTESYSKNKIYSIEFKNDNFNATMPNGAVIKGKWYADGSDKHLFNCRNVQMEGVISGDTIAERMYEIMKNAQKYDGDTNWLQIIQDKNTYMQFYN